MKKYLFLILLGLMAVACGRIGQDGPDGDTECISIRGINWAREPVVSMLAGVEENCPVGFSAPTEAQLQQIYKHGMNYFGTYNGVKGMLFSRSDIPGYVAVLPMDGGGVRNADYNRYTFTDAQVADGVFLPVNDGLQGFYWGMRDGPYYFYLEFGMNVFKVERCTQVSQPRLFTIKGGFLPVKN